MKPFPQLARYISVGILNTTIDFIVLNGLLFAFHYPLGAYPFFKAISFSAAMINSYYFNRHWVFRDLDPSPRKKVLFVLASVGGLIVNAGVATYSLFIFHSSNLGWGVAVFANISAILGTIASLIWNYCFYKYGVFRKNHD